LSSKNKTSLPLQSMTGFGSAEIALGSNRYRMEMKSLNHRYLEVKIRLPREFSSAEIPLRQALQKEFQRGVIELKVERVYESGQKETTPKIQLNIPLAKAVHDAYAELKKALQLDGPILLSEIAQYPEVFTKGQSEFSTEEAWKNIAPLFKEAAGNLTKMRQNEGENLKKILTTTLEEMSETIALLRSKREASLEAYPERIRAKLSIIFENFPLALESSASAQHQLLESRIAQELALLSDRTDIEEELVRFKGHLDHLSEVLDGGGAVGRKIDFILQELNREINTLGNKAQDFQMSSDVVGVKVKIEQLREQGLNIE
jgi:uncharacterized protein (TIGR00255 family)